MPRRLLVDWSKCTGCGSCTDVCSARSTGAYSEGAARIRIMRNEPWAVFVPRLCLHCEDHPCVGSCPVGAIEFEVRHLLASIDEEKCTGCQSCVAVCPHGGVSMFGSKALMCDLCGGDPACVKVCYPGALQWAEVTHPAPSLKKHAEQVAKLRRDLNA